MGILYPHPFDCPFVDGSWCDRIIVRPKPLGILAYGDCWIWTGWNNAKKDGPYGRVKIDGRGEYIHRVMWERYNGMLLQGGEVIDHLCRVRLCFSPHHVECTDHQENAQRRSDYAASFKESSLPPEIENQLKDFQL